MKFKQHLHHSHRLSIAISMIVLVVIIGLGSIIAERQRQSLIQLDEIIQGLDIDLNLAALLYERQVLELSNKHPTPELAFAEVVTNADFLWNLQYLDKYSQASRVANSFFRNNPSAAQAVLAKKNEVVGEAVTNSTETGATVNGFGASDATQAVVTIPWYVVFFGYEQYLCFLLAGICLGELITTRRRLAAEGTIATKTKDSISTNIPGDSDIEPGTAQLVLHKFNEEAGKAVFPKQTLDQDELQTMQRFAWVAMVNSLLEVFGRTGERPQALEAAISAKEAAHARFDGSFHLEQYLQWAIPSIGFLGTIRGISGAMGAAVVADDLPIVVSYLGVAFNSTMTALLLNLLLMYIRSTTLSRADIVFAELEDVLRRDAVSRLTNRSLMSDRPANGEA